MYPSVPIVPTPLMGAAFAYRNLGILRYSRRHVTGDRRRPECFGVTSHSCDWLDKIRLMITRAGRHLALTLFVNGRSHRCLIGS